MSPPVPTGAGGLMHLVLPLLFIFQLVQFTPAYPASPETAQGPFSKMHMKLEKTIFNVDALTLTLEFDGETRNQLRKLWKDQSYSKDLARKTAQVIYDANQVKATMQFLRDVDFERFIKETVTGARCAQRSGIISQKELDRVQDQIRDWYSPLASRGAKKGDKIVYWIRGESLHTVYKAADGKTLVDQTDKGAEPRLSVLGGFLSECSDFSKPLIQSLG